MRTFASCKKWFFLCGFLLITAFVYAPGLHGAFLFDDIPHIVENPALRLFDGSFSSLISASTNGTASPLGRPLSIASFALNQHFLGDDPFSFKLVNLLIHLVNGVLVFIFTRQLWALFFAGQTSSLGPGWVAAVWLLHPINLIPILFVVQRMTSLAAFFTLAALILYLHARQATGSKRWFALAASLLVCWPAAVFCKETGFLLPLFVLVCEWLALRSFRALSNRTCWLAGSALAVAGAAILAALWHFVAGGYQFREFSLAERLMTESRVLWMYVSQLLLPLPDWFSLYHDDIPISRGLLSPPATLISIAAWVSVIGLAIWRRKQSRAFAFAVAWFVVAHLLESTILPLEIAYEHRNYLASLGILVWLAACLFAPGQPDAGRKLPRLALAAGFIVFCGFVTSLRANQWGNEFQRTLSEVAAHPDSSRANYEAGLAITGKMLAGNQASELAYQAAKNHFMRALDIQASGKGPLIGLIYLDCMSGHAKDAALLARLRERISTVAFVPGDTLLVNNLSQLLVENRLCLNDDEVKSLIDAALSNPRIDREMRGMIYAVGMDHAAAKMHDMQLALRYARQARDNNPGNVVARLNLIQVLLASGDTAEAAREYKLLSNSPIAARDLPAFEQVGRRLGNPGPHAVTR